MVMATLCAPAPPHKHVHTRVHLHPFCTRVEPTTKGPPWGATLKAVPLDVSDLALPVKYLAYGMPLKGRQAAKTLGNAAHKCTATVVHNAIIDQTDTSEPAAVADITVRYATQAGRSRTKN
jgi:hypothetical protein